MLARWSCDGCKHNFSKFEKLLLRMSDHPAVVFIKKQKTSLSVETSEKETENGNVKKKLKNYHTDFPEKETKTLKEILENFNREITNKLVSIEKRIDVLAENYDSLEHKCDSLSSEVSRQKEGLRTVVQYNSEEGTGLAVPVSSRITFIALNSEEDYPDGSWLGNPENIECRVRCHISPTEMFHIHTTCGSAEKMALTLLDRLFDRETQACSNISGTGKHKKKQLDPLFIYGIKCHLNFHFAISEQDWSKIKQNMDSKCRTAFRRKRKGLPLAPKFSSSQCDSNKSFELSSDPEIAAIDFHDISSESTILEKAIKDAKGDFLILHATPEEVACINETELFDEGESSLVEATDPESPL